MIDAQTVQRIKESARIEEVVGDYVSLRRRGANLIGLCPFHNEKTPSFNVNPSRNIFKCFGCGKGGGPVDFIMEVEHQTYGEALRTLARKYGIEIAEKEMNEEERARQNERESMMALNEWARGEFMHTLHETDEGKAVGMSYLRERGTSDEMIKRFELGYSLENAESFTKTALAKGYKKEFLLKTGLSGESERGLYDRFHGRVIFPFHSVSGRVIGFGGRILKKKENTGKYVNSPQSEIYDKSQTLYGIYQSRDAIRRMDRVYLVEGYFDVISMHQSGVENVVASSGTSLTTGQVRQLKRFTSNITVMYDGDSAGIHASMRGIDMLLQDGFNVRVVLLPDGDDPDSFAQTHTSEELTTYLEKQSEDFILFKMKLGIADAGNDPVKQARMISDIVQSISVIPDNITRSVYMKECAAMMKISEEELWCKHNALSDQRRAEEVKKVEREQRMAAMERQKAVEQENGGAGKPQAQGAPVKRNPLAKEERELMRCVVKYGAVVAIPVEGTDEEGKTLSETWSVADYVAAELQSDDIAFGSELYNALFAEVMAYCTDESHLLTRSVLQNPEYKSMDDEGKIADLRRQEELMAGLEKHLVNHADNRLSQLAIKLCESRYELSDSQKLQFSDVFSRLPSVVHNLVWTLKLKIVKVRQAERASQLASALTDEEKKTLLTQIEALNRAKTELAEALGRSIK